MSSVITINKDGRLNELAIKEYSTDTLFRRAGFKQASGFGEKFRWSDTIGGESCMILAFGKTVGRAPQKNAFRFPVETMHSPGDRECGGVRPLFFGNIILVAMAGDTLVGLKKAAFSQAMTSWTFSPEPPPISDTPCKELEGGEIQPASSWVAPAPTRPPQGQPRGGGGLRKLASKVVIADDAKNCFDCSVELTEEAYI